MYLYVKKISMYLYGSICIYMYLCIYLYTFKFTDLNIYEKYFRLPPGRFSLARPAI